VPELKVSICYRQRTETGAGGFSIFAGTANPNTCVLRLLMELLLLLHTQLSNHQHSSLYGWVMKIVLGCNRWGWNKSITPSAGAAGVGFDATYDAWCKALSTAKGVVANTLC
jgi:hypothetical protein